MIDCIYEYTIYYIIATVHMFVVLVVTVEHMNTPNMM